jgi:hypothetical protein
MHCKNCKKEIEKESKFCQYCGEEVGKIKDIDIPETLVEIRNHLEFIGYELSENINDEGIVRVIARHSNHPNLIFTYSSGFDTYTLVSIFTIKKVVAENKKTKLLEALNHFNMNTMITTFGCNDDFDSITCACWHPNIYSRKEFANFLEIFESDINKCFSSELLKDFV